MYDDELLNQWIAEDKANQEEARVEFEKEADILKCKLEEKGLVFITYPKFVSLTSYLTKLLEHDDRTQWTPFSDRRIKPVASRSLATELVLNEYILKAKEERPDCIHYLERFWLEHEMKYAPSTVKMKMAKIRKHQKVGHILRAERKIESERAEQARAERMKNFVPLIKLIKRGIDE